jgi:hypothetical protein
MNMKTKLLKKIRKRFKCIHVSSKFNAWYVWDNKTEDYTTVYPTADAMYIMAKRFMFRKMLERRLYD